MQKADYATRNLTASRIKLIDELVVAPQCNGGANYYHLEVPSKARFYRLGFVEYVFVSLLDGKTSFAQALAMTARNCGAEALSQSQAMQVYEWLLANGLADFVDGPAVSATTDPTDSGSWLSRVNPFWLKVPLCRSDRLFAVLERPLGWVFSPLATGIGLLLIGLGLFVVQSNWSRFAASSTEVLSPHNWIWIAAAWIVLKVVHELSHGLVCRRHQGEVRELGLVFILFAPLAYVDVTSSWRFASRWRRIHVAVAGMYAELVLAAIAALIWNASGSLLAEHFLYNVILMASVSTILFNANPLLRFDGYYILSDLLEIPNLYSEGAKAVQRRAAWIFFGETYRQPEAIGWRGRFIESYGLAAFVTRILICASLLIAASLLFKGAGVVLALVGICSWLVRPVWRLLQALNLRWETSRSSLARAGLLSLALGGSAWALLAWAPSPESIVSPVVVEYVDLATVRAPADGFIERILVADGQYVEAGQALIQLRNEQLEHELETLKLQVERIKVKRRVAKDQHDPGRVQIEARDQLALEERLAELAVRFRSLQVLAPSSGRILGRRLKDLKESFVVEGEVLLSLGNEDRKELIVSTAQWDIEQVSQHLGQPVAFRIGANERQLGALRRLAPRASTKLPHAALSATAGGPLAVINHRRGEVNEVELAEPRFEGVISLSPQECKELACGQRGNAIFGWRDERLGQYLWRRGTHWFRARARRS